MFNPQDVALEDDNQYELESSTENNPTTVMPDGPRMATYKRLTSNPTGAQLRNAANKRNFPMLTDENFLADKKKKLYLEIEEMERQTTAREKKEKLDEELAHAKIDELRARKEFFETLTEGIKKKVTAALINEYFSEE